jgi:hypothetical protein
VGYPLRNLVDHRYSKAFLIATPSFANFLSQEEAEWPLPLVKRALLLLHLPLPEPLIATTGQELHLIVIIASE